MKRKEVDEARALIDQLMIDIGCMHQRIDDKATAERRFAKARLALASLVEIIEEAEE
jgi:hypothetical protein